jgi:hypothetical protein
MPLPGTAHYWRLAKHDSRAKAAWIALFGPASGERRAVDLNNLIVRRSRLRNKSVWQGRTTGPGRVPRRQNRSPHRRNP